MLLAGLVNLVPSLAVQDQTGGLDATAITIGLLTAVVGLGSAYLAFRGKQVNPVENGLAFVTTEAKEIAKFHRDDAAAARAENVVLRAALDGARTELKEALVLSARFRELGDHLPMGSFIDDGWLHALNEDVAKPLKVQVAVYVDDIDGEIALGYRVVPLELVAPGNKPTPLVSRSRRNALVRLAEQVRINNGLWEQE